MPESDPADHVVRLIRYLEPLVLHRWFLDQATTDSENAFAWLHEMHKALLA